MSAQQPKSAGREAPVGGPLGARGPEHSASGTPALEPTAGHSGPPGPAFDAHHPPSAELISDCVHCGFCLPTCPTYALWGEEMDSPRGRIYLMGQGLQGAPMTDTMVGHFDACLGCMACVTACPSGVKYDQLIEATRAQVERRHDRTAAERALRSMIFALFPYPARLRALSSPMRAYQRVGLARLVRGSGLLARLAPQLAAMESLMPQVREAPQVPAITRARGERRGAVGMLLGCVQREFFPGVNAATVRVLVAEGYDVVAPQGQGCCGALSLHAGREDEGLAFARSLIDTFEAAGVETIVVNSAGCGSAMKDYARLLADDPDYAERAARFSATSVDVAEFLAREGLRATYHPLELTVAYHDACHLAHAQGIRAQPRDLLKAIPGVQVKEIRDAEICCGSAGTYNILNPEPATELGDRKAANVAATGADLLVAANPGCLMQIATSLERAGHSLGQAHTIEVLDAALRAAPVTTLTDR